MRKQLWIAAAITLTSLAAVPATAWAQKIDCANEYRSGKLYFNQYKDAQRKEMGRNPSRVGMSETVTGLLDKAIERFGIAVEECPLKDAEYRWNNAIALGEAGLIAFENAIVATDEETRDALVAEGLDYYKRAKAEFLAVPETENGEKKKQLKMVRENTRYFWAEAYSTGLQAARAENLVVAARCMEASILMNPLDARSYHQGAVISFNAGLQHEAADMVQQALDLEIDPDNKAMRDTLEAHRPALEELQLTFYNELARASLNMAKDNDDPEELARALEYYDALVAADPQNPNFLYGRGVAHMSGGSLYKETDAAKAQEHYRSAGEDLEKAADIVTLELDERFHTGAVKAAMFAWRDAGDDEKFLAVTERFSCLEPLDPVAWRSLARIYMGGGSEDAAIAALMMSKSLAGTDVPVDVAVTNATDDAKAAVAELGNPSKVMSYQDGENTITTFIWEDHKVGRHYLLGKQQQEVTWCD